MRADQASVDRPRLETWGPSPDEPRGTRPFECWRTQREGVHFGAVFTITFRPYLVDYIFIRGIGAAHEPIGEFCHG